MLSKDRPLASVKNSSPCTLSLYQTRLQLLTGSFSNSLGRGPCRSTSRVSPVCVSRKVLILRSSAMSMVFKDGISGRFDSMLSAMPVRCGA
jgi:hypothetical protein